MNANRAQSSRGVVGSLRAVRRSGWHTLLVASMGIIGMTPVTAAAQTHMVIVSGLGGMPVYHDLFMQLSESLASAAHDRYALPASAVIWFGEDSAHDSPMYGGQSTRENIEAALTRIAGGSSAGDQLLLVLIGHGSGEGAETRISIPGPDLTATDLVRLLDRFSEQRVAVLDLTSASGDVIPILSRPNRLVVTATRSAFERNESQFARFIVHALAEDGADVDKDGRVSMLEAFRYATAETKRFYDDDSRLQTEHAQLDDNGDKKGSTDPDGREGDGLLARRFFLDAARFASGANDPHLATLYTQKFELEEQIDALRGRKPSLSSDAYDDQLEQLLISLALKTREIRKVEGRT